MSAICSGATRPYFPEIASEYIAADRPETFAAFPISLEINSNFTISPNLLLLTVECTSAVTLVFLTYLLLFTCEAVRM